LVVVLALQQVLVLALALLQLCYLSRVREQQRLWCWLQESLQ
jgi:hypothetical protein